MTSRRYAVLSEFTVRINEIKNRFDISHIMSRNEYNTVLKTETFFGI